MFVSDEKVLGVGIGVAQLRLANLLRGGRLSQASHEAYQGGVDHFIRVGPLGEVPGTSRLVRVQFVEPVHRDGAMSVGMRWETMGVTGGLFPVLDADIRLSGESDGGAKVTLTATYRPPFGPLGVELDRLLLRKVATATVKSFLAQLSAALEWAPETAAQSAPPTWWDTRREPELA